MDFLDIFTLAIIVVVVAVNVFFLLWLAALPGVIARERKHPQADAIDACGWLSLLTFFFTWPIAMIWAYLRPIRVVANDSNEKQEAKA